MDKKIAEWLEPWQNCPPGLRVTEYFSAGVTIRPPPREGMDAALAETGKASFRRGDLPIHVVFHDMVELALYMLASYREPCRIC